MSTDNKQRWTFPELARVLEVPEHKARYAIKMYGIEPVERVGIVRLFSRDSIRKTKAALKLIATRRGGYHA